MKAYIAISYSRQRFLVKEKDTIKNVLNYYGIIPFVFTESYNFTSAQEREMMTAALEQIDSCDLLIAETSDKAIGIGIEAGYAKAMKKPVIYMRNANAGHSTTLSGISDFSIFYNDEEDLKIKLIAVLSQILHQ